MSTAKKFAGQTAIYGLSTIAGRVLNFFLTPVYTHTYTRGIYGIFGTMFAWASMLNPLLAFGMETTFFRYLNKKEGQRDVVYNNSFGVIFIISAFFLLFTVPFIHIITTLIKVDKSTPLTDFILYTKYFIAIIVIDAWCVIPFAKLRADGRPGKYGMIKLLNIILFIGLNLTFIYVLPYMVKHSLPGAGFVTSWFRGKWIGYVFISNLVASVVTLLLLTPELLKLRPKFDKAMIGEMFKYSWPVLVANFSFILNENLDKLLLGKLLPSDIASDQVGIYTACAKISIFLSIFINAFRLGAEPFFFNHAKNKNASNTYARIMDYFVVAISLIFVGLVANINILKYFIDPSYWSGLGVVPILLFGYVSLGIYMNLSVWYKLSDQTKYGLYISGVGAILTVVLNWILIPKYSYMASAWVSLIAYATMMVLSYLWGQKNYPIPYNVKKNVTYLIASIVIVVLSFYVFNRNIFIGNGLLILFALAAFFAERKELMLILKKK